MALSSGTVSAQQAETRHAPSRSGSSSGVEELVFTLGDPHVDPDSLLTMVTVRDPGNPTDTNGLGHVPATYRIGLYEVTNPQYVRFLNAVAGDDPHGLYSSLMTSSDRGGILRSGMPGSHTYSVKPFFENKPVNGVNWFDAARYCNWLHNGTPSGAQGPGTTEDGAYDMSLDPALIVREPGARYFLPTHDEWYKAAYYDPHLPGAGAMGTPDYWFYPTRSDTLPTEAMCDGVGDVTNPGPNVANTCQGASWNGETGNVTNVGGCLAPSPWGAFDLGGNVGEMTETPGTPIPPDLPTRRLRGGDFANSIALLGSSFFPSLNMLAEGANIGFRVAATERSLPSRMTNAP